MGSPWSSRPTSTASRCRSSKAAGRGAVSSTASWRSAIRWGSSATEGRRGSLRWESRCARGLGCDTLPAGVLYTLSFLSAQPFSWTHGEGWLASWAVHVLYSPRISRSPSPPSSGAFFMPIRPYVDRRAMSAHLWSRDIALPASFHICPCSCVSWLGPHIKARSPFRSIEVVSFLGRVMEIPVLQALSCVVFWF